MSNLESNALASKNGRTIENQMCDFLGCACNSKEIVDSELDGMPLEIKSCQEFITVSGSSGVRRRGRFIFNEEQDQYLKKNGGIYALVVHCDGVIKRTRLLKASLVSGIVGCACCKNWKLYF
jgi:hypothetical protein